MINPKIYEKIDGKEYMDAMFKDKQFNINRGWHQESPCQVFDLGDEITEQKLLKCGFSCGLDSCVGTIYTKDNITVWNFNDDHWVVDALDHAGVKVPMYTMSQLDRFFHGCRLSLYDQSKNNG
jgi:hypothetical protein